MCINYPPGEMLRYMKYDPFVSLPGMILTVFSLSGK